MSTYSIVVPTSGRPSLGRLLDAVGRGRGPAPDRIVLVDDRRGGGPLDVAPAGRLRDRLVVLRSGARGPAAARNVGWRATRSEWVAFLDDDVVPDASWRAELAADLAAVPAGVGGVQGQVRVPRRGGRPTDWERNVGGLEAARWATADMAYRRRALLEVNGFDERFPRAYREDCDIGLRITGAGWRIERGRRAVAHPVPPADRWVSLRKQAGNADDALMDALHGDGWRERGGAPAGARSRHMATTGAALSAAVLGVAGRPWPAAAAGTAWAGLTAGFAWRRIAPGPRTADEVLTMALTSAAMPFVASGHFARGVARARRLAAEGLWGEPAAVLFDRDDTLVRDVPYNGDPAAVEPLPGAAEAVARVRAAGLRTGVVSNQSGVARGLLTPERVIAVNARVDELLGPFDTWQWCPHGPADGCECRKPGPGLVRRAAASLGVPAHRCVVIGDIGADVEAAAAAGARGILVPTGRTRDEEIAAAPEVAGTIGEAVERVLRRGPAGREPTAAVQRTSRSRPRARTRLAA